MTKAADDKAAMRVQCLDDFEHTDLTAARNEYIFRTPVIVTLLCKFLKDERDWPVVCLLVNILTWIIPGATGLFVLNIAYPETSLIYRNIAGLIYFVGLLVLFLERFLLMMHFSAHRPAFHGKLSNEFVVWVVAPFFGVPSGLYRLHHLLMHHTENNHANDTSSTEQYQRDSFLHFIWYWVRFFPCAMYEQPAYAIRVGRPQFALGFVVYWSVVLGLANVVSLCATMWVFIIPHVIAMSAMAFGNWSQHIFVDPARCESNYALTYNCIDCPGNQTTWNDGYHVIHHMHPRMHWSELPSYFHENRQKFADEGSLTFRGIHFFEVGVFVMTGQLRKLAEHYVHLGSKDTAPTYDEIEQRFRDWLVVVPEKARKEAVKKGH